MKINEIDKPDLEINWEQNLALKINNKLDLIRHEDELGGLSYFRVK